MSKSSSERSPWWRPHIHRDRRPFLLSRARMAAAARAFFSDQSFIEVDTAILQVSPGNEAHISAFRTEIVDDSTTRSTLYLHSSPEFAAKKLLAAGEERIFTFAHVFRNRERGRLHHPEFTMLEWYRAGEPYQRLIEDCMGLLARRNWDPCTGCRRPYRLDPRCLEGWWRPLTGPAQWHLALARRLPTTA